MSISCVIVTIGAAVTKGHRSAVYTMLCGINGGRSGSEEEDRVQHAPAGDPVLGAARRSSPLGSQGGGSACSRTPARGRNSGSMGGDRNRGRSDHPYVWPDQHTGSVLCSNRSRRREPLQRDTLSSESRIP